MYKVIRVNEYGQTFSSKGLLQFHNEKNSPFVEFSSIDRAKQYSKSFVRRYPFAICEIHTDNSDELIEFYRDEEYWSLKNKNAEDWKETNKKGQSLAKNMILVGIIIVSLIFGLVSHYLGVYDVPSKEEDTQK